MLARRGEASFVCLHEHTFFIVCFLISVVSSSFKRKGSRQQLIRISFNYDIRLTLSPVTGRRPDYTILSVDIGVTDVTKNVSLLSLQPHVPRF